MLVDDHPIVRSGLRAACTDPAAVAALTDRGIDSVEIVAEAANGQQALDWLARARVDAATSQTGPDHRSVPDVVLMDLQMDTLDGVSATRAITAHGPRPVVLVVTTYDSDADILAAVEAGAAGYVLKDAPAAEILHAALSAARGEPALAPSVEKRLTQRETDPQLALTTREIEILTQIATGASNAQIAQNLFISRATVKTHLVHIFDKLGVDNRTAAVKIAQERRILSTRP